MQRQDSLHDQLKTVHNLAVQAECYDAADFIRRHIEDTERRLKEIDKKYERKCNHAACVIIPGKGCKEK